MNSSVKKLSEIERIYAILPIEELRIGKDQMRTRHSDRGIEELAASIEKVGLLEPIIVTPKNDDGFYEILTGQRRFLACKYLDLEAVPSIVLQEEPAGPNDNLIISITENMMRSEPSDKDYIDACTRLYSHYGDIKLVAEETGLALARVREYVKAPQLIEPLKRAVEEGQISMHAALAANKIAELDDNSAEDLAIETANSIQEKQMGPRQAKQFAARVYEKAEHDGAVAVKLTDLDSRQKGQFLKVSISDDGKSALGRYARDEQLELAVAGGELITTALQQRGYLEAVS